MRLRSDRRVRFENGKTLSLARAKSLGWERLAKMQGDLTSCLRLGWLIDPKNQRVEIYRQGQDVEVLQSQTELFIFIAHTVVFS